MSNGKGQAPRKGYNWAKYAANYDGIFRRQHPTQRKEPMKTNPEQTNPTPAPTPRTDRVCRQSGALCHRQRRRLYLNHARTLERELQAKDAETMHMLHWIGNKMLEPEWDSFKKSIEVADHWKARASTATARARCEGSKP